MCALLRCWPSGCSHRAHRPTGRQPPPSSRPPPVPGTSRGGRLLGTHHCSQPWPPHHAPHGAQTRGPVIVNDLNAARGPHVGNCTAVRDTQKGCTMYDAALLSTDTTDTTPSVPVASALALFTACGWTAFEFWQTRFQAKNCPCFVLVWFGLWSCKLNS